MILIVAGVSAFCASALSEVAPRPEGIGGPLFTESFDDADLLKRGWYDGRKFTISQKHAYAGKGCIEYAWRRGTRAPYTSSGIRREFKPTDTVYVRYYLRLSKGWGWTGRGYHPHLTHFLTTANDRFHGPARSHLTVYVEPQNGRLRLAATDMQNVRMPHGLTQGALRGGFNGKFYDSGQRLFSDADWHCVEAMFKLNSLDLKRDRPRSDGELRGWFDGKLVIERTDVIFRTTDFPNMEFNQFLLLPYFGPRLLPHAQTLWIDELAVGTQRIGPIRNKAEAAEGKPRIAPRDKVTKRLAENIVRSAGINTGLCVHLGCTDGHLTAELAGQGKFVVHGVASTREAAETARRHLQSLGLHGTVSIHHADFSRLPYVENLVNLVVVDDFTDAQKKGLPLEEVMRVLCPNGAAWLGQKDAPAKVIRKKRPAETDEWTHWLHDPGCTNLSSDALVGPGARLQWMDGPNWLTAGNVTELFAGGRSFNVMGMRVGRDDVQCVLIARDAFNGLVLWKRVLATGHSRYSPRVVVAAGERVFAVMKNQNREALVTLDAATGKVVRTYDLAMSPQSVLYLDGQLIVTAENAVCSVNAETGAVRWRIAAPENTAFRFTTPLDYSQYPHVVCCKGRLFVFLKDAPEPPYSLVCYDVATGAEKWRKRHRGELLKCYEGVLALVEQPEKFRFKVKTLGTIRGVSAEDGRKLWDYENVIGLHSDANAACSGGLFWVNADGKGLLGLDPATGSERKRLKIQMTGYCGYVRTTERHFLGVFSRFVSTETGESFDAGCYKNACAVGQVPANGMVYTFPIACSCCPYLRGFLAFAPAAAETPKKAHPETEERLEKGPAYGVTPERPTADARPGWNTFRHDPQRSGSTDEAIPRDLKVLWSQSITDSERTPYGKSMTPPVVAEGKVFVAAPDAHQVCALDAKTGEVCWRYLLDGRVEVPPTVHEGLCLFGANDGWVYCLRATDGTLIWRFRAAPEGRRILVRGRLESPWPVPGVLVTGGVAYFAAGRHARGPEGISLYAMEPATGSVRWRKHLQRIRSWKDSFVVNDLLVGGGQSL
ncbi:MAG: hypothetical protein AMK75_02785, partial [Planctomycetes bacterium SM23_65]